ncbi:hypothetical protein SS50377_27618 [Spironucleus salmonicida]|uniref:Uncharacterized protein n=1 Tax=Spironucleus salmonicida TaxID=348837 RepID=V6LQS7_9EUKA|nr:hypothetical protein SS50377_27618 [Spironucleus salmonicida]|eukprot:EST46603.1 Hypothetical protein SS50377_13408 [Spironucleus salmonicida]
MQKLCTQMYMDPQELVIEQFKEPDDILQLNVSIEKYINYLNRQMLKYQMLTRLQETSDDEQYQSDSLSFRSNKSQQRNKTKWRGNYDNNLGQIYRHHDQKVNAIRNSKLQQLIDLENKQHNKEETQEQLLKILEHEKLQLVQQKKEKTLSKIQEVQEKRKILEQQKLQKYLFKQK